MDEARPRETLPRQPWSSSMMLTISYWSTRRLGVLIAEQHIHMALGISDRAYLLSHGELVLEGDASELAERSDLLEASYLGENVL